MNLFSADDSHAVPPIGPSWFLRDIIILTLLTPLLVRVKVLLFPAVLLFFCFFSFLLLRHTLLRCMRFFFFFPFLEGTEPSVLSSALL